MIPYIKYKDIMGINITGVTRKRPLGCIMLTFRARDESRINLRLHFPEFSL